MSEAFTQFIEFGTIFDRPTREFIVEYLKKKVHLENNLAKAQYINNLNSHLNGHNSQFIHFQNALDKVFENDLTLQTAQKHTTLAAQVLEDLLRWMQKTHQKIQTDNPFYEETQEYNRWKDMPAFLWVRTWYNLTNFLKETYEKTQIDISFYEKKFEDLTRPLDTKAIEKSPKDFQTQLTPLELVAEDLLHEWKALLTAKRLEWELEQIDKERELFCQLLYAKIEEFVKLLQLISPFEAETGRLWDMSSGKWQNAGFDILQQYAEILKNDQAIQDLADMLGKMREAKTEIDEEVYENIISKKAWVTDYDKKDEIGGVFNDNYLPNVLPSEIAYMGVPDTETFFWKKYVEKELLSFRYEGKKLITSDKIQHIRQQKIRRKEKGPFIICIDTSGSMEGLPEQIAKTLCFAILKMAAKEHRKAFLISFSVGIKTINLLDLSNSMEQLLAFLTMSFHGGTDVAPALVATIEMLQTNDYKEADVLMVSDFVMFEIREDILKKIRQEQTKDTRFHSLTISNYSNPEIIHTFDNNWRYDPQNRTVIKQLVQDLGRI